MSSEGAPSEEKGFSPEEFVHSFEAAAELKVDLEMKLSAAQLESGYCKESDDKQHFTFNRGAIPDEVYAKQAAALNEAKEKIPHFDNPESAAMLEALLSKASANIDNKHEVCKYAQQVADRFLDGQSADALAHNKFAAEKLYESIYGTFPTFELEGFFESEVGVVFTAKSAKDIQKFNEAYAGTRLNKEFKEEEDFACTHVHRGIPVMMTRADVVEGTNDLRIAKHVYAHELQHNIDAGFTQDIDQERRDAISVEYLISRLREKDLKSEIYAYAPRFGLETFRVLTDEKSAYNYDGVLDMDSVADHVKALPEEAENDNLINRIIGKIRPDLMDPEVNIEPTDKDKYLALVRSATTSLVGLAAVYNEHFKDDARSYKMAIAMMDSFPMQDWETITRMVKRYSVYPEWRDELAARASKK